MTRMVSTDETTAHRGDPWGNEHPSAITRLESSLTTAFHAAEYTAGHSYEHRVRTYDDIMSAITDAGSAAARSGYAAWALSVVDAAQQNPPAWAEGHAAQFWDRLLDAGRDALLSTLAA